MSNAQYKHLRNRMNISELRATNGDQEKHAFLVAPHVFLRTKQFYVNNF